MTHTPESFRTAADFLDSIGYPAAGASLRLEADKLESKANENKRIDELGEILINTGQQVVPRFTCWEGLSADQREATRAGVRAILAKLDEEKAELKRINGGNGGWPTSFDHPETVSIILGGTE